MKMAELMREVANLPQPRQAELAAFLLHLRLQQDPAWRTEMTRRIDDPSPDHWISLKDCKRVLRIEENQVLQEHGKKKSRKQKTEIRNQLQSSI